MAAVENRIDKPVNIPPVSGSVAGIVDLTSLQELGGVDKTINGVRIGRGNGNLAQNTVVGNYALPNNLGGYYLSAFGNTALAENTEGFYNSGFGAYALASNETGDNNSAFGAWSLDFNILGNENTVIGSMAGSFLNDKSTHLTNVNSSIFIGHYASALEDDGENEIVIGGDGNGSNTVTIGNTSITDNYFTGNVRGGAFVKSGGTSSQFLMADGSVTASSGFPYVPYTGATANVNLDTYTLIASGVTVTALTLSQLVATDGANNLISLSTSTYPDFTELSYVKGTTSSIQTQINSKENTANKSTTTTLGTSNTLFPTQNAVKIYVDTQLNSKVSLTGAETLTNKRIVAGVNAQTGTNYTLVATDFSGWVTANNVLAQTYTLPQQSALATNNGDSTKIININNSFITLVTQGSDIIIGNTIIAPFQSIDIRRTTSTTWETFGGSATINDGFSIPVIKAATANDVSYFTIFAPYAGTILSCSQLSDSLGTAGTYTVSINGVNVTGLTTVTNTVSKTTTTATGANTFAVGSTIKVTLSAAVATAVNISFTLLTSKVQ